MGCITQFRLSPLTAPQWDFQWDQSWEKVLEREWDIVSDELHSAMN